MRVIHKFKLVGEVTKIRAPIYRVLCAQVQRDDICLWAEVVPENESQTLTFRVIGTGQEMMDLAMMLYIGTVQQGSFVWHIYQDISYES